MNHYKFLKIYREIAKGLAHPDDLRLAYWDLKYVLDEDAIVGKFFKKGSPSKIEMALAIDAVAHNIHKGVNDEKNSFLAKAFPGAPNSVFKEQLDLLAGMEKSSEIRKANRGFATNLLATKGMIFLEKQQVGMTVKEDISDAIDEYERLFIAQIASPAEILTLYRYYGPKSKYAEVVRERELLDEENEPLVVGGPASSTLVDREGHLITSKALEKAFDKFMDSDRTRNINVFHSDVQVGWALPAYITKSGKIFKSGVDEKGLWLISEIRDDTRVAARMAEEIEKGNIRSYSIAGSAIDTEYVTKGAQEYMEVREMELAEVTLCITPDTKIWTTLNGYEPSLRVVTRIKSGDLVMTHTMQFKKVIEVMEREINDYIYVIENEHGKEIRITGEHPILIIGLDGSEWVPAKDVRPGQTVKILDDKKDVSYSDIKSIKRKKYKGKVYNLEVEGDNSYVTAAMAVHNCERGVNQGAFFDILKSDDSAETIDQETAFNSLPLTLHLPHNDLAYFDNGVVVIKADRDNSLTDAIQLELRKYISDNIKIKVSDEISGEAVPLFKDYGDGYFSQLTRNYPEFNNISFTNYVGEKTGKSISEFNDLSRGEIDRISEQWLKDKSAIKPEFSTAYVQKAGNLSDFYPEAAKNIDGDLFKQSSDLLEEHNYRPSEKELEECHVCIFYSSHFCTKLHAPVKPEYVCDVFAPMPGAAEAEAAAEAMNMPFEEKSEGNEKMPQSKIEKLQELIKQWQDEEMKHASDWEATEAERRTKLREFQDELGFPQQVDADPNKGYPEVEEETHLPWNVNVSGRVDKS